MATLRLVLFDAANTLIHKPALWERWREVLARHGLEVAPERLRREHRLLSEETDAPDVTGPEFYARFNASLLDRLGLPPHLAGELYGACRQLPWESFPDVPALQKLSTPLGVLSNFNARLPELLAELLPVAFQKVWVSAKLGLRKPDPRAFRHVLEELGARPEEVLFVGDSPRLDYWPARELGLQARLIDREGFHPEVPERIASLGELAA